MPPIGLEERKKLILSHPLFEKLSSELLKELVSLTTEKHFGAGEIVVSQDEVVDAIYFIAKGEVEVDREVKDQGYCLLVPQAVLRKGDTIGLNRVGFYSETGLRTATLKTVSDCTLIGWDLGTFNAFLQQHPDFHQTMGKAAEIMQRINFIKQVEPFAELPKERLVWLSKNMEEITVLAGTILFRAGDLGNECYLVRDGEVEISIANIDGTIKKLATIVPPMLFGETALLTTNTRTANAQMVKTGKLLILKKEQLKELMQYHTTTEAMMLLSVERCRPVHSRGVVDFQRTSSDGQNIVILKDTNRGKYFQLSEEGWFIWNHLDGTNTLQDLAVELFKVKRIFCPEAIAETIFNLADAGFVLLPEVPEYLHDDQEKERSFMQIIRRYFHIEITFDQIDEVISATYKQGVYLLFSRWGLTVAATLILCGIIAFFLTVPQAIILLPKVEHWYPLIFVLIVANLTSVIFHELAHGYTTKYFGREVHRGGIILSWVRLIAFVDTSDMWLGDKRSKIIVSLAGPLSDFLFAGISSLIALAISSHIVSVYFWLFSLTLYYSIFKNLNPLMENDGYYLMKDFFDHSNLRAASLKSLFGKDKWRKGERLYLQICGLFIVIDVLLAFVFQYLLRLILPATILGISTWNLIWILPLFVLLKYVLSLFLLIRRSFF